MHQIIFISGSLESSENSFKIIFWLLKRSRWIWDLLETKCKTLNSSAADITTGKEAAQDQATPEANNSRCVMKKENCCKIEGGFVFNKRSHRLIWHIVLFQLCCTKLLLQQHLFLQDFEQRAACLGPRQSAFTAAFLCISLNINQKQNSIKGR